jgi:hypothetical protein
MPSGTTLVRKPVAIDDLIKTVSKVSGRASAVSDTEQLR